MINTNVFFDFTDFQQPTTVQTVQRQKEATPQQEPDRQEREKQRKQEQKHGCNHHHDFSVT